MIGQVCEGDHVWSCLLNRLFRRKVSQMWTTERRLFDGCLRSLSSVILRVSSSISSAVRWCDCSPLCQNVSLTLAFIFHPAERCSPLGVPSQPPLLHPLFHSFPSSFLSSPVIPLPLWPTLGLLSMSFCLLLSFLYLLFYISQTSLSPFSLLSSICFKVSATAAGFSLVWIR